MAKPSPSHAYNPSLLALGKAIKDARTRLEMSQEALALASGLDRSYVGGLERGEQNIALINLIKLSKALRLSVSELLEIASI